MRRQFLRWPLAGLLVVALVAAGCGGDDDDAGDAGPTTEAETTDTSAAAEEDPLAPQPLAERKTVVVSISQPSEPNIDVVLADALGEFEKENLDFELAPAPIADGTALLIGGRADVMGAGVVPPILNAIAQGNDLTMIMSGPTFPADDDFGIWARDDLWEGEEVDPCAFEGATVAPGGVAGWSSAMAGKFVELLAQCDLAPTDINLVTLRPADSMLALQNGSVDAAFLTDPFWGQAKEQGGVKLALRYGDATSNGWMIGTQSDPEVIDAFIRAVVRTRREYLQGDYKQDPEVRAAMMDALGVPEETLDATPALIWNDGEWNDELFAPLQDAWFTVGGILAYDDALTTDEVYDPTILERVLGG